VGESYGDGDAVSVLMDATQHEPLLLIISDKRTALRDADLDKPQRAALLEFLGKRLPELLAKAAPQHAVRVLISIEHSGRGRRDKLVQAVRKALERAQNAGLTLVAPPEIELPQWGDVEEYLETHVADLNAEPDLFDDCRAAFDAFNDLPARERTFVGLTARLTEIIEAWDAARLGVGEPPNPDDA
jgi:hypothetical protein